MMKWALVLFCVSVLLGACLGAEVRVEKISEMPHNPKVQGAWTYSAKVSFYIEHDDGTLSEPLWTTRAEEGGEGKPYYFSLSQQLMEGFRIGIKEVREGERARIHVPPEFGLGFEDFQHGNYSVPGGSNLVFDVELENLRMGFASDENDPVEMARQQEEAVRIKKEARKARQAAKTKKEQAKEAEKAESNGDQEVTSTIAAGNVEKELPVEPNSL